MGAFYLDERDVVRFDPTPDARWKRQAMIARGLLAMADQVEHYVLASSAVLAKCGRGDPSGTTASLVELQDIRDDVLARAAVDRRLPTAP